MDRWTLETLSLGPSGRAWLALRRYLDGELAYQATGYQDELDALMDRLGIEAEEL